jgi:hypothetical protein
VLTDAQDDLTAQDDPAADGGQEGTPGGSAAGARAGARARVRLVAGWVTTALACLLLVFALSAPNQIGQFTPLVFVRIPAEGLIAALLALVLPARLRQVTAGFLGVCLGLLTLMKILDMGFNEALDRPFDLVGDWPLLGDAVDYVGRSYGQAGATGAVIVAVLLVLAVLVLMTLSMLRLTRLVARYRTTATPTVAAFGVVWVICAALGLQILPGMPFASKSAAGVTLHRLRQAEADYRALGGFSKEAGVDAFRDTPGDQLLTALRGKDVLVSFVESYGRVALDDPQMAPQIGAILDDGTRRLDAAGFASRSAFLTSPTAGGGSWLAHSTLLSGVWINNQQRYSKLLASKRFTLNRAFQRAGWRTVDVEPGLSRPWPQGAFYGSDRLYTAKDLGYRGPTFNFRSMPDQYTLNTFQKLERSAPDHAPVMAEMVLLSSHSPWAPLPHLVDWDKVGDGTVFAGMPEAGDSPSVVRDQVRAAYRQSIEYTLSTLISYLEKYGDKNLVLVFLGDHQPAPLVAGTGAVRQVPVTIVARDPAVLDRISGWGWQPGLKPAPQSPVWPMNQFRDRFLTAFGSQAQPAASPSTPPH